MMNPPSAARSPSRVGSQALQGSPTDVVEGVQSSPRLRPPNLGPMPPTPASADLVARYVAWAGPQVQSKVLVIGYETPTQLVEYDSTRLRLRIYCVGLSGALALGGPNVTYPDSTDTTPGDVQVNGGELNDGIPQPVLDCDQTTAPAAVWAICQSPGSGGTGYTMASVLEWFRAPETY